MPQTHYTPGPLSYVPRLPPLVLFYDGTRPEFISRAPQHSAPPHRHGGSGMGIAPETIIEAGRIGALARQPTTEVHDAERHLRDDEKPRFS